MFPTAAYVHVPFCRRRCFYCDFPISVLGDRGRGETSGTVAQYVEAVCQEIALTPAGPLPQPPLQTVFFGGGTPSLLAIAQLDQLLSALDRRFGIAAGAEISIEMDPGTFDWAQLQGYRALGVNRISLGIQAFDDDLLQACGRSHSAADGQQALDWLRQSDVPSWSLDLIAGLPHQSLDRWAAGLGRAIALQPPHIAIYDLTVEPQTVFHQRYQSGQAPLPSDEQTAAMYRLAQQQLTASGYQHYEISNYAQSGHQCRHNRTYWENRPYYGFGMGAASYVQGRRFIRPRTLQQYRQWLGQLAQRHGQLETPITPPGEQFLDQLMVGLRLAEGVAGSALQPFCDQTRWRQLLHCLRPHLERGWILLDPWPGSAPAGDLEAALASSLPDTAGLRLSDPEGFLFSNQVLVDLFQTFAELIETDEAVSSLQ